MSLSYDIDSQFKNLLPVLDEHSEWFTRVTRQVFYPEKKPQQDLLMIPDSFEKWAVEAQKTQQILPESLMRLRRVHADMHQAAKDVLKYVATKKEIPEVKLFDSFVILYDEFVALIRRLERDVALADSGIDMLTGLRTKQVMVRDLERELERRSRRGRPFCLALSRIDHYKDIKFHLTPEAHDRVLTDLSTIIKLCIRSFDDAYRLSEGEFLICLKQTEMAGGTTGLNRLRRMMEERAPYYVLNGKEIALSMSSVVAEPQPGDTLDEMIGNMRDDLNKYGGNSSTLLEYIEVSPLQRFIVDLETQTAVKN